MKIRIGNDFKTKWAITWLGDPEDFSDATDIALFFNIYDKKIELIKDVDYTITDNIIEIDVTPDICNILGVYNLELHYTKPNNDFIDGERRSAVDIDAFRIVGKSENADATQEVSIISDAVAIFLDIAYKKLEEIEANEDVRIASENERKDAEDIRVENENIRISNERDRQTNTATAISSAEQATLNANNSATYANEQGAYAEEMSSHPPTIINDYWHIWNFTTNQYESTGQYARGDSAVEGALVVQEKGQSAVNTMSQKAVTDELVQLAGDVDQIVIDNSSLTEKILKLAEGIDHNLIYDEFWINTPSSLMDNSDAVPIGKRFVKDPNSKISIANEHLTIIGEGSVLNPILYYNSIEPSAGLMLFFEIKTDSLPSDTYMGISDIMGSFGNLQKYMNLSSSSGIWVAQKPQTVRIGNTRVNNTYKICVQLLEFGSRFFIKNEFDYPEWTLLYEFSGMHSETLYTTLYGYINNGKHNFKSVKIPKDKIIMSPLISESFNRGDSQLRASAASYIDDDGSIYLTVKDNDTWSVIKSTDGGNTYSQPLISFDNCQEIMLLYKDVRGYLYTAPYGSNMPSSQKGLWMSKNDGTTWIRVVDFSSFVGYIGFWGIDENNSKIYATTYGATARIYSSGDGENWEEEYHVVNYTHCHSLSCSPNGDVYVTTGDLGTRVIAKYTAATQTWNLIPIGLGTENFLGVVANENERLYATDGSGSMKIYRTTDDINYTLVYHDRQNVSNYWMRRDKSNGYIYAGCVSGNNIYGYTTIVVSRDNGMTWNVVRKWIKKYTYDGPVYVSNIKENSILCSIQENAKIIRTDRISFLEYPLLSNNMTDGLAHYEGIDNSIGSGGEDVAWSVTGNPMIKQGVLIFNTPGIATLDSSSNSLIISTIYIPSSGAGGIVFRYSDDNNYWYLRIDLSIITNNIQLIKRENGVNTVVKSETYSFSIGESYVFTVRIFGSKFSVAINNAIKIEYSDVELFNEIQKKIGLIDEGVNDFMFGDIYCLPIGYNDGSYNYMNKWLN